MPLELTENEQGFIRFLKHRFQVESAELRFTEAQSLCLKLGDNVVRADDTEPEEAAALFPGELVHWTEADMVGLVHK
jgi:hypothetical protein